MKHHHILNAIILAAVSAGMISCSEETITNEEPDVVKTLPEWYYSGGRLGTTLLSTSNAFEQPAPAIERQGLYQSFKNGFVRKAIHD